MKKIYITIAFTILIVLGIIFMSFAAKAFVPQVQLVLMQKYNYSDGVNAKGIIEQTGGKTIKSEFPFVPEKIMVDIGDEVTAGETIAVIDKEATQTVLTEMYKSSPESIPRNILNAVQESGGVAEYINSADGTVSSDKTGVITEVNMTEGNLCDNEKLAVMATTDALEAKINVNESDIASVKKGQRVSMHTVANSEKTYTGYVKKIYPTATKQTEGTKQTTVVSVSVSIENADKNLKSGFTVSADISTSDKDNINIVPYESVDQDEFGNEYVYIYQNGVAVKRQITTGKETKYGIEIIDGINKNDFIIYKAGEVTANASVTVKY